MKSVRALAALLLVAAFACGDDSAPSPDAAHHASIDAAGPPAVDAAGPPAVDAAGPPTADAASPTADAASPTADAASPTADASAAACAAALAPASDGSDAAHQALVLSEINPGDFIELYNDTAASITLSETSYQLCSPFVYVDLAVLAPTVVIPAHSYATVPFPASFTDNDSGGEIILYTTGATHAAADIMDFVCWGTDPHGSRKSQAESVNKWDAAAPCAGALSNGSITRLAGTAGTNADSYSTSAAPTPQTCTP